MQDFTVLAEHFQYDDVTAAHFALRWLPYTPSIILHFFGFVQAIDMDIYGARTTVVTLWWLSVCCSRRESCVFTVAFLVVCHIRFASHCIWH